MDEKKLIKVFYNGLKPEMKEVIRMKEPEGHNNHKLAVLKMQSATFCKVISTASQGDINRGNQRYNSTFKLVKTPTDKARACYTTKTTFFGCRIGSNEKIKDMFPL